MKKLRIALFASGEGSNAQNTINHFRDSSLAEIVLIVSNNSSANVLQRANDERIQSVLISKNDIYATDKLINDLNRYKIDLIVLVGFLWIIPQELIKHYPSKIINIHPSLLPKFGGKGMYGMNVHKAVIASQEIESGITIHYVNENYDRGKIIKQYSCKVLAIDTAETLAKKIQVLEKKFLPKTIEQLIKTRF